MSAPNARPTAEGDARVIEPTIFELSRPGRRGFRLPEENALADHAHGIPERFLRQEDADLPENAELNVLRHYTRLSTLNHHIEREMYPLGSCTMKYNPKLCEVAADLPGFRDLHPAEPAEFVPGAIELLVDLQERLAAGYAGFARDPSLARVQRIDGSRSMAEVTALLLDACIAAGL